MGKWIGNWYRTDARRLVVLSKFVRKSRYIHLTLYSPRAKPAPSASAPFRRSAFTPFRSLEPIRFAPALETDAKNANAGELSRFRLSQLSFYSWILMTTARYPRNWLSPARFFRTSGAMESDRRLQLGIQRWAQREIPEIY